MGPQHESCGKPYLGIFRPDRCLPSMGPQHESCGKLSDGGGGAFEVQNLQWGRNMRVAERSPGVVRLRWAIILQWGRNMRVAERPRCK